MRSNKKGFRRRSAATGSVDVHCHVFNAWDLPVRRFVELVYLEKYPGAILATPLIDFIEFIMRSGAPTTGEEIDYLTRNGLTLKRLKRRGTRAHNIRAVSQALTLMWVTSPKDRQWVRRHLSPSLRRRFKGKRNVVMTPADFSATARDLMMARGDLATWIHFALIYTWWRWEITHQLASLSKAQTDEVFLYTPAILDIGTRLREPDTSDIGEQVEVMRLISRLKGKSYAVHAFVAFDPFRAIGDRNALAIVKDAVLNQGAIGVKIYPPMGIKPCDNSGPLGDALNQQMKQFLGFCLKQDVPILAHCTFSQYVSLHPEDGACAAPEAWRAFLQQPGHKNLRLDLGHCGGPWDFDKNPVTKTIWTQTVIELLGDPDAYPNLYADVSDDSWILDPDGADNQKLMRILSGFLQSNLKARARLLYGSDWSLLAREAGANDYYDCMKTYFCDYLNFTPAERRGFLGGNAVRFLGLAKNPNGSKPKNRLRLEQFRSSNKLDMSIFSKIDALSH
jgi:predicted TIM-barrel fold metal-dependent hydrolase